MVSVRSSRGFSGWAGSRAKIVRAPSLLVHHLDQELPVGFGVGNRRFQIVSDQNALHVNRAVETGSLQRSEDGNEINFAQPELHPDLVQSSLFSAETRVARHTLLTHRIV